LLRHFDDCSRTLKRASWTVETGAEAIARGLNFASAETAKPFANRAVVGIED
jgi:hypothetical protein